MIDYKEIYTLSRKMSRLKFCTISKCEIRFTHAEVSVMMAINYLNKNDEGNATTSLIAKDVQMPKPQVSRILNTIEKAGMIERVNSKSDRREVYVLLTENGKKYIDVQKQSHDRVIEYVYNKVGEKDFNEFIRILGKIEKALEETEC